MSDWIKLHASSFAHPKLRRLARRLELPPAAALGHLASLWCFAAEFAPDGDLSALEVEEIAEYAGWRGDAELFVSAAAAAGLLDREDDSLVLHDWADWGGRLAERRASERQRSAARRASAPRPPVDRSATAGRPPVDQNVAAGRPPLEERRAEETRTEEKRAEQREERARSPLSTALVVCDSSAPDPDVGFTAFWAAYPRKEDRRKAEATWQTLSSEQRRLAGGVARLMRELVASGQSPPLAYVLKASSFLAGERWEDWRAGPPANWRLEEANATDSAREASLQAALARYRIRHPEVQG